jgi:predicted DNA-binding protein with PD1-like motif
MKQILKDGRRIVLRFDSGEEIVETLKKFLSEEQIFASAFNAIGASKTAELSYFNLKTKKYENKIFEEDLEIVSLIGNSAILNGEVVIHAHTVLSKSDFSTVGGHVARLVISATCEMFLIILDGQMERKFNPESNLNLLN